MVAVPAGEPVPEALEGVGGVVRWPCRPTSDPDGLTTMGRGPDADPTFFAYAAAAGLAAHLRLSSSSEALKPVQRWPTAARRSGPGW